MSRVVYKGHDVKNAEICNTFFLEVKYYTDNYTQGRKDI